ncbi:MAG: outer membrane lipoprotein-sorting protein [Bacteroidetes bacterium]|nr:MAG: outer membrane lipoprotein-sorting protein [Bacteroidota bacterium]
MKALKFGFIFFITCLGAFALHAQTADDIINKHIEAIGGKEKLKGIKSLYAESSLEVMGNEAPSTTYILNGKGFKSETDFNGQKIVQCVTDTGGWMINPMLGQTTAEAIPADQLRGTQAQFQVGGPLLDYASKGHKVEYMGKEDVNGAKAYKLKLTTKDSATVVYYIDSATNYLSKAVTSVNVNGQPTETTIAFSDYQKTDYGYVMGMKQDITLPQGITLTITYKKVEINKDIDPKIFQMPKS